MKLIPVGKQISDLDKYPQDDMGKYLYRSLFKEGGSLRRFGEQVWAMVLQQTRGVFSTRIYIDDSITK